MTAVFTREELEIVKLPVNGEGGAESLLRDLVGSLGTRRRRLTFSDDEVGRIVRYAYLYHRGGFQRRFRVIVKAMLRTIAENGQLPLALELLPS